MKKHILSLFLFLGVLNMAFGQTYSIASYDYLSPNGGLAVWLRPSWKTGLQKYAFTNTHGNLATFSDGTALLTGTLVNINDANEKWYIELSLRNKKDWTAQQASGNSYCDPSNFTGGQHTDWDYYELDPNEDNVMEDVGGTYGYATLDVSMNTSCGFQVGYGANGVTAVKGFGGWFSVSGSANGTSYTSNGGFCAAICDAGVVSDFMKAHRFDHLNVQPYTHALYVNDDNLGVLRYVFGPQGGTLIKYADGSAHLYGEVFMISNNEDGVNWQNIYNNAFEVNIHFTARKDWTTWSANGGGYYDEFNVSNGKHTEWDYYIMDPNKPNTLSGRKNYKGTVLFLNHMPADLSLGAQLGVAATSQNVTVYGIGGWFDYTVAKSNDGFTGGRGDINMYLTRSCKNGEYLFGIKGGRNQKNKRLYTLDGSSAQIESENIPFKSNALAHEPGSDYVYFIETISPFNLARYDLGNGSSEVIGSTGLDKSLYRLDFDANGTLYGSRGSKIYTINTTTGTATLAMQLKGFLKGQKKGRGDIAFAPNGDLYLLTKTDLFTVDLISGRASSKGAHGISLISGMDFNSNGDLVVSNIVKEEGVGVYSNLYSMDPANASSTLIGNTQVRINDLTFMNGCYSDPEARVPSCLTRVKTHQKKSNLSSGLMDYDLDFDADEEDELDRAMLVEDLEVYPTLIHGNAENFVNFYSTSTMTGVHATLIDQAGRVMKSFQLDIENETRFALGHLENGLYVLSVNADQGQKTFKIMVSK